MSLPSGVVNVGGTLQANNNLPQGGRILNMSIPAGQTQRAVGSGLQFYLVVATASVNIRPLGGDFVNYPQGTGLNVAKSFAYLEIQNPNAFPVVVSVWVGNDDFIDKRLILANSQTPSIAFPTYPIPGVGTFVNIVDLSGGSFLDINGVQWLALFRESIIISNLTSGSTYKLSGFSPVGADTGTAIGMIPPGLPVRYDVSGNYTIPVGAAPQLLVSEIYSSILANTL
jgi:hypothetical protein